MLVGNMKESKKKVVRLPLTDEQKKIVKDALGTECSAIDMPANEIQRESYKAKSYDDSENFKLILTEEQKELIQQLEPNSKPPGFIFINPNWPGAMTAYAMPTYGINLPLDQLGKDKDKIKL